MNVTMQTDQTSPPDFLGLDSFAAPETTRSSSNAHNVGTMNPTDATAGVSPAITTNDGWKNLEQGKQQMIQAISTQWQNKKATRDQILKSTQQQRDQMRQGLQSLGNKLQQGRQDFLAKTEGNKFREQFHNVGNRLSTLNFGGSTNHQGGLSDSLSLFNERMKEEALRRDVRREAEEACMQTMREHLDDFLQQRGDAATYEEWIFALHPENTQDASLLQDMEYKEVDLRFYIEESDHRRLWNETVKVPHRKVAARARVFGGSNNFHGKSHMIDLLGGDGTSSLPAAAAHPTDTSETKIGNVLSDMQGMPVTTSSSTNGQQADLISF